MDEMTETPQYPGWTLDFDLKREELVRFNKAVAHSTQAGFIHVILIGVCIWFSAIAITTLDPSQMAGRNFMFGGFLTVILYVIVAKFYADIYYRVWWPEGGPALSGRKMNITAEGIVVDQPNCSVSVRWPAISQIIPDESAVYLLTGSGTGTGTGTGYTIPYRALPPDVAPAEFLRVLRSFKECTRA